LSLNWKPPYYFHCVLLYNFCFINTYTLTIYKLHLSCHLNLYCRYDFLLSCLAFAFCFLLLHCIFFPTHVALLIIVKFAICIFFWLFSSILTSSLFIWKWWFTKSFQNFQLPECSIQTPCMWSTYLLKTKILFLFWNFNLFVFP